MFILVSVILLRPLGVAGIALADTIAVTSEAVILLALLNRKMPGLLRVEGTLLRVMLVSVVGALLVYGLMLLPFPALLLALAALAAGGLLVLPFIWPEVKLLIKL
jgi:peptidoglycan biosynthesis protein MviN/MurJ (putative lipid II flippase)